MTLIEPRFRRLFLPVFAVFTLFGTSLTIIGATLPKILANFHWNYLTAGIVLGAGAVAYFVSTFVAGYLVKHWGSKPTILLALTLIVAGLAFFAASPDPVANTLLSALIGLGQGGVEVGLNSTILRMDERNTGRPMNLLHGGFAIGAILGPFAVSMLMQSGLDWAFVYRGMSVIFVALAVLMAFAAFAARPAGSRRTRRTARATERESSLLAVVFRPLPLCRRRVGGLELGRRVFCRCLRLSARRQRHARFAVLAGRYWSAASACPCCTKARAPRPPWLDFQRWRRRPSSCLSSWVTCPPTRSPPTPAVHCCFSRGWAARSTTRP